MITEIVKRLRPGAAFMCDGETYEGITWLDEVQTQPTEPEVEAMRPTVEAEIAAKIQLEEDKIAQRLINKLDDLNFDQIDTYVDNNITTLAANRALWKRVLKLLKSIT